MKTKKVKTAIGWKSNEYAENPSHVIVEFTPELVAKICQAQALVQKHNFDSIRIFASQYTELKEGKKESDFRPDVELFIVYNNALYYYAQCKYDSATQIESQAIQLPKDM